MKKIIAAIISIILLMSISLVPTASAAESVYGAGVVATSSSPLNVRQSASTSSAVLTSLPKNSYVTLISKSGSWWRVAYGANRYGYCSASYIREVSSTAGTVSVSAGNLNVRSGAGTGYNIIGKLPKGQSVLILSSANGWHKVLYNGTKTGYVSASYIKTTTSSGSSQSSVRLTVPSFKQMDSRWANILIGSSGKTIGAIGCTTTCLAMTESYRTGTTITPDAMSKKLSYSSTGSLYWPQNYVTDTAVTYEKLKTQLRQGKPVILGLKTNAGNTHWVVVTGFSGSTYYINDPGSNIRTTLSEALAKYPSFYKMAYYR